MSVTSSCPDQVSPTEGAPISVGAGFLALDWLLIGKSRVKPNGKYAGGSCGNVLSILACLGWDSYPVARLGRDHRAKVLIDDLQYCHVNTDFVGRERTGVTPVIILRIAQDKNGAYKSRFEWKDPQSGDWLPRYRPLPKSYAKRVSPELPVAKVFYFDRAEPSSLLLATKMRENGAVVFFEPSSCKDDTLFTACLAVSDIVKYSAERVSEAPRNPISKSPRLEIQTLGDAGLRFRLKMATNRPGPWHDSAAFPVHNLQDATGCGDWCSAGIIHHLCANGRQQFMKLPKSDIVAGIRFGQALAAINCEYQGARGPMYHLIREEIEFRVQDLLTAKRPDVRCRKH